jgi:hypothetical protein
VQPSKSIFNQVKIVSIFSLSKTIGLHTEGYVMSIGIYMMLKDNRSPHIFPQNPAKLHPPQLKKRVARKG